MGKMERETSILTEQAWNGLYPAAAAAAAGDDDYDYDYDYCYGDDNPKE
jgi:hypothetical protein